MQEFRYQRLHGLEVRIWNALLDIFGPSLELLPPIVELPLPLIIEGREWRGASWREQIKIGGHHCFDLHELLRAAHATPLL